MRAENERDYRDDPAGDEADPGVDQEPDLEADPAPERRRFDVGPQLHGQRLDKLLVAHAGEFSRSHLQSLIERGCVEIDGVPASSASRRVRVGESVCVVLMPTDESRAFIAEPMALAVRFEDEHLLVLSKPAGLVVHPAPAHWRGTLMNGLLAHHRGARTLPRGGIVHRLDKDTSGLMVVAKTLLAMTALVRSIAARDVHRAYLALVHGEVARAPFSVEAPIGRDPVSRVRMAVVASGKPARTDVAWQATRGGVSAVRCVLHTGRTHQIRVHLALRGHPLLADALYGGARALGLDRQALHATQLAFKHPIGGRAYSFDEPLPDDLTDAWASVCD